MGAGCGYTAGLKSNGTVVVATNGDRKDDYNVSNWNGIVKIFVDCFYLAGLKYDVSVMIAGRKERRLDV